MLYPLLHGVGLSSEVKIVVGAGSEIELDGVGNGAVVEFGEQVQHPVGLGQAGIHDGGQMKCLHPAEPVGGSFFSHAEGGVGNNHTRQTAILNGKLAVRLFLCRNELEHLITQIMYSGLVHAHSGLRWIALVLLVAASFVAISKWLGRSGYTDGNRKLYLFTLISVHVQLVLGLILYFISPKVNFNLLSDKIYRFYSVEHITGMLIAIVLVTVGYSLSKRATDVTKKQRLIGIFYGIGLVLILLSIPWPGHVAGAGLY